MAVEVLELGAYGLPATVWALGVTMWEVASVSEIKKPLPAENLLEDMDGVLRPLKGRGKQSISMR